MRGVVLHGGSGTRLRPLTHTGPKQLIPIANKPVSQYAVEDLLACGIKEIAFVLGDIHPEKVREHYGDGSTHGARFTYIPQEDPLGIAHAIGLCREFDQDSPFVGRPMLESLNIMFDGQGLVDEPYKNGTPSEHGIYQTYKLALHITLQTKLSQEPFPGQVENLLIIQGQDGGFHTGYDQPGTYAGTLANAETTSIVIITLNLLASQQAPSFPFVFPQPLLTTVLLYLLIVTIAGIAITAVYIYWERRRTKTPIVSGPS